jgi:monoamine oxidase
MAHSLFATFRRRFGERIDGPTRREFLERSLAAEAGLLLSGTHSLAQLGKPTGEPVVVIGAGFAWLAAAHKLLSAGTMSPSSRRDRVGGRVLTFDRFVRDRYVEGGGELIGRNHPVWLAYAKKFGLDLVEIGHADGAQPIVVDGRLPSDEEARRLWAETTEAFPSINCDARIVFEDEPWNTPNAGELDRRSAADWLARLPASRGRQAGPAAQFSADNGVSQSIGKAISASSPR